MIKVFGSNRRQVCVHRKPLSNIDDQSEVFLFSFKVSETEQSILFSQLKEQRQTERFVFASCQNDSAFVCQEVLKDQINWFYDSLGLRRPLDL